MPVHLVPSRSALLWVITKSVLVIPDRRFGTNYRSYLQQSRYFFGLPNNSEKRRSHLNRGGILEMTHTNYEFNHTTIRLANKAVRYPERLLNFRLKNPAALNAVLGRLPYSLQVNGKVFFQLFSFTSFPIIH